MNINLLNKKADLEVKKVGNKLKVVVDNKKFIVSQEEFELIMAMRELLSQKQINILLPYIELYANK